MSLGGLILEPVNKDFWVTLGSVSNNQALKQHSFIRALHLDMSLSEAWAYLGKVQLLMQQLIDFPSRLVTNILTFRFTDNQVISNWQDMHLIELEALILHWPCHGRECRLKIITNLGIPLYIFHQQVSYSAVHNFHLS